MMSSDPTATKAAEHGMVTETVTLQVQVPPGVEVGATINVLYEGNYYQIVVPENAPGNSIQVVLPNVPVVTASAEKVEEHEKHENAAHSNDLENKPHEPLITRTAALTAVGVAVVGTVLAGPIAAGVVVLGGAAVYVAAKRRNVHHTHAPPDPNTFVGKATVLGTQAATTVKNFDSKYEISSTASKVVHSGVAKAKELDEKAKISESISSVSHSVAENVKATNEKYKITEKTSEIVSNTVDAVKTFDENHRISATASATASHAAEKAKEFDEKYEISSSITRAFSTGLSALSSGVTKVTGSTSHPSAPPSESVDL